MLHALDMKGEKKNSFLSYYSIDIMLVLCGQAQTNGYPARIRRHLYST